MTRKISFITVVAVAALTVVPSAFGEGRLAGSQEPTLATPNPMIEDGFARAVAAGLELQSARTYRDANERGSSLGTSVQSPPSGPRDAFERAVVAGQLDLSTFNTFERAAPLNGLESNASTYRDAFERGTPVESDDDILLAGGDDVLGPDRRAALAETRGDGNAVRK